MKTYKISLYHDSVGFREYTVQATGAMEARTKAKTEFMDEYGITPQFHKNIT